MKLQGITILRIRDLIDFFDLAEFWQFRQDFSRLLTHDTYGCFYDSMIQKHLGRQVASWLNGDEPRVIIDDDKMIIHPINEDIEIPLGRLTEQYKLASCKENDLRGLTALYIMLGGNNPNSCVPIQYKLFESLVKGNGSFRALYNDYFIESDIESQDMTYQCGIIANMNAPKSDKNIRVEYDGKSIRLSPLECLVGLFNSNNKCVKLLPNKIKDYEGMTVSLRLDKSSKTPSLRVETAEGVTFFQNVSCFTIEAGGQLVYLTLDGVLHFDSNKCFNLNTNYEIFRKNRPDEQLLAFETTKSGGYIFYTKNGKNR